MPTTLPRAKVQGILGWSQRGLLGLLALVVYLELPAPLWPPLAAGLGLLLLIPAGLQRLRRLALAHGLTVAGALALLVLLGPQLSTLSWLNLVLALLPLWLYLAPGPAAVLHLAVWSAGAFLTTVTPADLFRAGGFFLLSVSLGWVLARIDGQGSGPRSEVARLRQQVGELLALRRASYEIRAGLTQQRVIHSLADEAQRLTGASHVVVAAVNSGGTIDQWSAHGYSPAQIQELLQRERSTLKMVLETGRDVLLPDAGRDPQHRSVVPHSRSMLAMPIGHRGQVVGALQMESPEPAYFRPDHQAMVHQLAEEGGWALHMATRLREAESHISATQEERQAAEAEVARRMTELEAELDRLRSVHALAEALSETGDRAAALARLAERAQALVEADGASVWLRQGGGILRCRLATGPRRAELEDHEIEGDAGLHGWAVRTRQPVLVKDLAADTRPVPAERLAGARSVIVVPCKVGSEVFGCLSAYRLEPGRPFTEEQRDELKVLAEAVSPPLASMGAYVTSSERERVLRAMEGLQRDLAGPSDIEHVFRAFLRHAPDLVAFDWAGLARPTADGRLSVLSVLESEARLEASYGEPSGSLLGEVLRTGQTVRLDDLEPANGLRLEESLSAAGMRSLLAVPLFHQGQLAGALALAARSPGSFDQKRQETLEAMAQHLAPGLVLAAFNEARSQETQALQRQSASLASMLRLGNALRAQLNVDQLLEEIVRAVREGLGYQTAQVYLRGPGDRLVLQVSEGPSETGLPDRVPDLVALMREESRVSHSYFIPHYRRQPGAVPQGAPGAWHPGDVLVVPLRQRDGQLLGVLSVDRPKDGRRPTHETAELLQLFAAQASVAIQNARLYAEVEELALTDGLLGIHNRRFFDQRIVEEFGRSVRYQHPLSLMIVEVDRMKEINDRFGHQAGDRALQTVAQVLRDLTRSTDLVCRYGGDEIAIILPETLAPEAARLADRLRREVAAQEIEGHPLSICVGVAAYPTHAEAWEELVRQADEAVYAAKEAGRNRVLTAGQPLVAVAAQ